MRLLILLLPWLELFTLIQLGINIGAFRALLYVLATLVAGVLVLRVQGRDMFRRLRAAQEGRVFGPQIMVDDMAMGLAGLLLIIPGLITDTLALLVLFGPLRRRLAQWLFGAPPPSAGGGPGPSGPSGPQRGRGRVDENTIEGDFRRLDESEPDDPWRQ